MTPVANLPPGSLQREAYFPAIDSLRALAVAAVVLYHLDKRLVAGGFVGVDVFFVVSGYVVSLTMARFSHLGFGAFIANFYARRILRISPALIVCLLVTAVASCMFIPHAWVSDANARTGLTAFLGLSNIVLARPDNAYFEPRAELNPFTHTWSLAVEEQFYVVFPLLFWFLVRRTATARGRHAAQLALTLLVLGSLACCAAWTASRPSFAFYLLPSRFWELGLGLGLFVTQSAWSPFVNRLAPRRAQVLAVACLLMLVGCFLLLPESPFPFPGALIPVACTVMLIALIVGQPINPLPAVLISQPVLWLGKVSYSLYLWHWPVLVIMRWTVGLDSPGAIASALALSLTMAALSYYAVERPVRNSARLRNMPRARVAFGGLAVVFFAMAAGAAAFKNEPLLSLSITSTEQFWRPTSTSSAAFVQCHVDVAWQGLEGGGLQSFRPTGCPAAAGTLYVVGDSHGGAYAPMLVLYAKATGREVAMFTKGGCSLFDIGRPPSEAEPGCKAFDDKVLTELKSMVRPGDVLFLPGLRIDRLADQWGGMAPRVDPTIRHAALQRGTAEVTKLLLDLSERGARVLLEAPKPLFKAPPFRCSDWFNASNPVCRPGFDLARSELDLRRSPFIAAMRAIGQAVPRTSIWDPAEILCPGPTCHAFREGKPLFFDGDHLSESGNALLADDFTQKVNALLSAGLPNSRQVVPAMPSLTR